MSESLTVAMQNASLANRRRLLIVDALNFLHAVVPTEEETFREAFAPALFRETERRVHAIASAARAADLELLWVFDNGQSTEEAREKWQERRFKEVMDSTRRMPCSAETVFFALLEQAGFLVLYPPGIDGDDAVALLAWHLDGIVLSRDRDLLRYEPELPRERVFREFAICGTTGHLLLQPQGAPLPDDVEPRDLKALAKEHLPDDTSRDGLYAAWGMRVPTLFTRALAGESKRGNADRLTAECGNLNQHALPLLASIYHSFGATSVAVTLPAAVRDDEGDLVGAELVTTVVPGDACVDKKLVAARPELAKAWLEASTYWAGEPKTLRDHLDWEQADAERDEFDDLLKNASRAHAVCMLAAEIVDASQFASNVVTTDESYKGSSSSSSQRIWAIYKELVREDVRLNPHLFTDDCWTRLSESERTRYTKILAPDATVEATCTNRNEADDWCRTVRCKGLSTRGNTRVCKAMAHEEGLCFPSSVAMTRAKGKNPLCAACVCHISQNRRPWSLRARNPPGSAHGV